MNVIQQQKSSRALLAVLLILVPLFVFAGGGLVHCGGEGQNPCTGCDFGVLIINITDFLIWDIAVPFGGVMIVVGGLMIMFGAASEERVKTGKKILTNTIIGVVIVFLAWLVVDTIIKTLVGDLTAGNFIGAFGPWNEITGTCVL